MTKNILKNKILWFGVSVLAIAVLVIGLASFTSSNRDSNSNNSKKQIAVSIFPYKDLAKEIAGDDFEVSLISSSSNDPHSFDPAPGDISKVLESDVYFYSGEIDEWAGEIVQKNSFNGKVFKVEEVVEFAEVDGEHDHEEGEHNEEKKDHSGDEHGEDHSHSEEEKHSEDDDDHMHEEDKKMKDDHDNKNEEEKHDDHDNEEGEHSHSHDNDPHLWVSPKQMKKVATEFAEFLKTNYPETDSEFAENLNQYLQKMDGYDAQMTEVLACSDSPILVSHKAFDYLGRDYGVEVMSLSGVDSHSVDGSVNQEVIAEIKEKNIQTIYYDASHSKKDVETLATELNLDLKPVSSLETSSENSQNYDQGMNLIIGSLRSGECGE